MAFLNRKIRFAAVPVQHVKYLPPITYKGWPSGFVHSEKETRFISHKSPKFGGHSACLDHIMFWRPLSVFLFSSDSEIYWSENQLLTNISSKQECALPVFWIWKTGIVIETLLSEIILIKFSARLMWILLIQRGKNPNQTNNHWWKESTEKWWVRVRFIMSNWIQW